MQYIFHCCCCCYSLQLPRLLLHEWLFFIRIIISNALNTVITVITSSTDVVILYFGCIQRAHDLPLAQAPDDDSTTAFAASVPHTILSLMRRAGAAFACSLSPHGTQRMCNSNAHSMRIPLRNISCSLTCAHARKAAKHATNSCKCILIINNIKLTTHDQ